MKHPKRPSLLKRLAVTAIALPFIVLMSPLTAYVVAVDLLTPEN